MMLVLHLKQSTIQIAQSGTDALYPWLLSVSSLHITARVGDKAGTSANESSSITVRVANVNAQFTRVVRHLQRVRAQVLDDAGKVAFEGVIASNILGYVVELTIEAGGLSILLSENLPLRTSQMLGNFTDSKVLPRRYGDLTTARFTLVRLSDTRALAADHFMQMTSVYIADQLTTGWEQKVESDDSGHTWTIVEFSSPVPTGAEITGCGIGKLDDRTGLLLSNPADIFRDIMLMLGLDTSWSRLRSECSAAGIAVAFSLDEITTGRQALDSLAYDIGAIWTPGFACLYPMFDTGFAVELDRSHASRVSVSQDLQDTADILRVAYDFEEASGRPQKHLELVANPQRFGGLAVTVELKSLRSTLVAEQVGTRLLQRMAGQRYRVAFGSDRTELRPGTRGNLIEPVDWPFEDDDSIVCRILETDVNHSTGSNDIVAEYVRDIPQIAVTAHSQALSVTEDESVEVSFNNGLAEFIIRGKQRLPLSGAQVSLDGSAPKTTDARGVVSFFTTRGHHILYIKANGFEDAEIDVYLGVDEEQEQIAA